MGYDTKLLIVSDTYHPLVDGTVRFIDEFLKRAKDDFSMTLLVPEFGTHEKHKGIHTTYLQVSKLFKPLPTYPLVAISWKNLQKIKQAVQQADIVFAQGPALGSYLALHYAQKYHKKAIYYVHVLSWELMEKATERRYGKVAAWFLKKVSFYFYNKCNEIFVPYNDLKQELEKGGVKTPLTVAKLGIDIERFSPPNNKEFWKKKMGIPTNHFVVGYVGRISKEKNIDTLLRGFAKLQRNQQTTLLLVGDGSEEERRKCREVPNCVVTGFVENVQDYLKAMDVFVMPSLTETTSLATLEAMATGLPVIASKVGYIKHYVTKEENGLFFPRDSATMLAIKLEKLRREAKLRQKLGGNARKTMAYSFSWERSINRIKKLLREQALS